MSKEPCIQFKGPSVRWKTPLKQLLLLPICLFRYSHIIHQKSPNVHQKSTIFYQQSPTYQRPIYPMEKSVATALVAAYSSLRVQPYNLSKEPYNLSKELYNLTKKPCIQCKGPYILKNVVETTFVAAYLPVSACYRISHLLFWQPLSVASPKQPYSTSKKPYYLSKVPYFGGGLCWNSFRRGNTLRLSRGGGLGSRPKKMYGERLGDGVEYHLMSPTPRR